MDWNNYWEAYWSNETSGGHRKNSEEFLQKESKEKLLHLEGGESLLDFGCGSADLLVYYADYYKTITGVDISPSMIQKAEDRLKNYNKTNVNLMVSDEKKLWGNVSQSYDRITAGQVVQYFNLSQVEDFISESSRHLNNNGKIILFDIIDTDLFLLFKLGLFKERASKFEILKRFMGYNITKAIRIAKGLPGDELGTTYHPETLINIAKKYNLESERVSSMYYEYRYHLMLTKKTDISTN